MKKIITDVNKQEKIVEILYTFHENQKKYKHDTRYQSFKTKNPKRFKTISTKAVDIAIKKIMRTFGYDLAFIE